jgi:hypothetical protein
MHEFRPQTMARIPQCKLESLRNIVGRRGWTISDVYVDNGAHGNQESRPALNRLMADAHRRCFDAVAVWKFDRFARSVSHLLRALETFNVLGIGFHHLYLEMPRNYRTIQWRRFRGELGKFGLRLRRPAVRGIADTVLAKKIKTLVSPEKLGTFR